MPDNFWKWFLFAILAGAAFTIGAKVVERVVDRRDGGPGKDKRRGSAVGAMPA